MTLDPELPRPRTVQELADQLGITVEDAEDYLLPHVPGLLASLTQADADLAAGNTVDLEDVLAELGQ